MKSENPPRVNMEALLVLAGLSWGAAVFSDLWYEVMRLVFVGYWVYSMSRSILAMLFGVLLWPISLFFVLVATKLRTTAFDNANRVTLSVIALVIYHLALLATAPHSGSELYVVPQKYITLELIAIFIQLALNKAAYKN